MLSSFTLISLIGVMLGVLVLIVVMAVYAGLERDVKSRLLGFTPHILLRPAFDQSYPGAQPTDWDAAIARAKKLPHVETAIPYISDNVIIDVGTWQRPVLFRGIDTTDPAEVKGIASMLDEDGHPGSTADMGIDDRVVISSIIADQFRIGVGDTIRLYSTRNFEQVMDAYKATENPPVHLHYKEAWAAITTGLEKGWKTDGDTETFPIADLAGIYETLDAIRMESIRAPEEELIEQVLLAMEDGERDDDAGLYRYDKETRTAIEETIATLGSSDAEKMDNEIFKGLKNIVLPKEAEVVGIYLASQMAVTPDIFVPLPLAQSLAGLEDTYHGIALRLDDPYRAEGVAAAGKAAMGGEWTLTTWGEQYQAFFALINQQRVMMYFALSFIVLVSAFSMMAVMFTVTIQKRREIGVMKALGAAPGQIVRVFLYQGMILGVLGAILGVGLGRLVIHFRGQIQSLLRQFDFDPFSASFTGFGVLPAHNNPVEQTIIAVLAFILCSLAALVPAFFAARSDAAKSLRNL